LNEKKNAHGVSPKEGRSTHEAEPSDVLVGLWVCSSARRIGINSDSSSADTATGLAHACDPLPMDIFTRKFSLVTVRSGLSRVLSMVCVTFPLSWAGFCEGCMRNPGN
jgi:hypothetical protein